MTETPPISGRSTRSSPAPRASRPYLLMSADEICGSVTAPSMSKHENLKPCSTFETEHADASSTYQNKTLEEQRHAFFLSTVYWIAPNVTEVVDVMRLAAMHYGQDPHMPRCLHAESTALRACTTTCGTVTRGEKD